MSTQYVEFTDWSSFVGVIRQFQSGLARPKRESAKVAEEAEGDWDGADEGQDADGQYAGQDWDGSTAESGQRMNDFRQAAGSLKGQTRQAGGKGAGASSGKSNSAWP